MLTEAIINSRPASRKTGLRSIAARAIINQLTARVAFRRTAATALSADDCPTPGIRFKGSPLFLKDPPGVGFS
jgi:hypothetical protein